MATSKPSTPLRYPGGKSQFYPFIKSLIDVNQLEGGHYFEPYAGGAGVALSLLYKEVVSEIHINDIDTAIYDFWMSATHNSEEFIKLIHDTDISMETWYKQKEILNKPREFSQLERGFSTFFLNRTNRSGILKGGVIGGKNQTSIWKLDARFNKKNLIEQIQKLGANSNKIHVYNEDAKILISKCEDFLPKDSFIYLDPPYYVKGQGLYRNFYTHEDHVSIKNTLKNINFQWVVSYDDNPAIKDIYSEYRQEFYSLSYSAQKKRLGAEIIIYSDNVKTPENSLLVA
jgi:DNA adenine methylase